MSRPQLRPAESESLGIFLHLLPPSAQHNYPPVPKPVGGLIVALFTAWSLVCLTFQTQFSNKKRLARTAWQGNRKEGSQVSGTRASPLPAEGGGSYTSVSHIHARIFVKCRCLGPTPCVGQVYHAWFKNLHFNWFRVTLKEGSWHTQSQKPWEACRGNSLRGNGSPWWTWQGRDFLSSRIPSQETEEACLR